MPVIELQTLILAPPAVCYAFNLDVGIHLASTWRTRECVAAGRPSGQLQLGEVITWEARHLGIRQRLTVQITAADPPCHSRDEMLRGAFRCMRHDHYFEPQQNGQATLMRDVFAFESPGGPIGHWFNRLYLTGYLTRFLEQRNAVLKQYVEVAYANLGNEVI